MIVVLAALMTYSQVESLWLKAGGSPFMAPTMAAIAVAESHPIGDTHHARMALANYDRHELGGSFCGFQIQRMHTTGYAVGEQAWDRQRLLHDPAYCTRAAVSIAHNFGLDVWTTHRTGEFLAFIGKEEPKPKATSKPRVTPQQFMAYVRAFGHAPPKNWAPHDLTDAQIAHMGVSWTTTPNRPAHDSRGTFHVEQRPLNDVQIILCGLAAILLVQLVLRLLLRAFRAGAEAEEAYRRRTRRRAYEGRPLRRRVPA